MRGSAQGESRTETESDIHRRRVVVIAQMLCQFALITLPMRFSLVFALFVFVAHSAMSAAPSPDKTLTLGLQAWLDNGVDAGLRTWFADRPELAFEMKNQLQPLIKELGDVIDTEVVAIQPISKRVTRYYVAVYFTRAPLWLRVERYASEKAAFYLPLRFSTDPDRILPGYLTEFLP